MNNNTLVFHYFDPSETSALEKRKKREPNMFISYRKEMMRYKPYNMKMSEFSKLASERWKGLTKDEKTELQRKYQINRDKKSQQIPICERVAVFQNSNPHDEVQEVTVSMDDEADTNV